MTCLSVVIDAANYVAARSAEVRIPRSVAPCSGSDTVVWGLTCGPVVASITGNFAHELVTHAFTLFSMMPAINLRCIAAGRRGAAGKSTFAHFDGLRGAHGRRQL
eukprot:1183722-Prorocentrum_minimum.AAC.2